MTVTNSVAINRAVCTGCGVCIETCPTDVLAFESESKKAYVAYPEDCQACFVCVLDCPYDGAVTVSVGLGDDVRELMARAQFAG